MYARNFYEYYKYSDLEHFIRINPVSKRCAVSIGNILCEYYTVPRLITDPIRYSTRKYILYPGGRFLQSL